MSMKRNVAIGGSAGFVLLAGLLIVLSGQFTIEFDSGFKYTYKEGVAKYYDDSRRLVFTDEVKLECYYDRAYHSVYKKRGSGKYSNLSHALVDDVHLIKQDIRYSRGNLTRIFRVNKEGFVKTAYKWTPSLKDDRCRLRIVYDDLDKGKGKVFLNADRSIQETRVLLNDSYGDSVYPTFVDYGSDMHRTSRVERFDNGRLHILTKPQTGVFEYDPEIGNLRRSTLKTEEVVKGTIERGIVKHDFDLASIKVTPERAQSLRNRFKQTVSVTNNHNRDLYVFFNAEFPLRASFTVKYGQKQVMPVNVSKETCEEVYVKRNDTNMTVCTPFMVVQNQSVFVPEGFLNVTDEKENYYTKEGVLLPRGQTKDYVLYYSLEDVVRDGKWNATIIASKKPQLSGLNERGTVFKYTIDPTFSTFLNETFSDNSWETDGNWENTGVTTQNGVANFTSANKILWYNGTLGVGVNNRVCARFARTSSGTPTCSADPTRQGHIGVAETSCAVTSSFIGAGVCEAWSMTDDANPNSGFVKFGLTASIPQTSNCVDGYNTVCWTWSNDTGTPRLNATVNGALSREEDLTDVFGFSGSTPGGTQPDYNTGFKLGFRTGGAKTIPTEIDWISIENITTPAGVTESHTFTTPAFEYSLQNITVNLTFTGINNITDANLTYNGKNFTPTETQFGSDWSYFRRQLRVPLKRVNNTNFTFNWTYFIDSATDELNTTTNQQQQLRHAFYLDNVTWTTPVNESTSTTFTINMTKKVTDTPNGIYMNFTIEHDGDNKTLGTLDQNGSTWETWNVTFTTPVVSSNQTLNFVAYMNVSNLTQLFVRNTSQFSQLIANKPANVTFCSGISNLEFLPNLSNVNLTTWVLDEQNVEAENVSVAQNSCVFQVADDNTGNLQASINGTHTYIDIHCDDDNSTAGSVTLNTSLQNLGSYTGNAVANVTCWADYNNVPIINVTPHFNFAVTLEVN